MPKCIIRFSDQISYCWQKRLPLNRPLFFRAVCKQRSCRYYFVENNSLTLVGGMSRLWVVKVNATRILLSEPRVLSSAQDRLIHHRVVGFWCRSTCLSFVPPPLRTAKAHSALRTLGHYTRPRDNVPAQLPDLA